MFFYILLFIWILVVPAIIILSRKDLKTNIRLILAQVYNFIVGITAWLIFFITLVFTLKYFGESELYYIILGSILFLIFSILLIPFNIYMKKKINMNIFCYIFLSILIIGLGIMVTMLPLY